MAAKSQTKVGDRKSSRSGGSGSNLSAKSDSKHGKKRVTMEVQLFVLTELVLTTVFGDLILRVYY